MVVAWKPKYYFKTRKGNQKMGMIILHLNGSNKRSTVVDSDPKNASSWDDGQKLNKKRENHHNVNFEKWVSWMAILNFDETKNRTLAVTELGNVLIK